MFNDINRYNFLTLSAIAMAYAMALNNYIEGPVGKMELINKGKTVIACNTTGLSIFERNLDVTITSTEIIRDGTNKCPHSSGKQGLVCALTGIRRRFMKLATCS